MELQEAGGHGWFRVPEDLILIPAGPGLPGKSLSFRWLTMNFGEVGWYLCLDPGIQVGGSQSCQNWDPWTAAPQN